MFRPECAAWPMLEHEALESVQEAPHRPMQSTPLYEPLGINKSTSPTLLSRPHSAGHSSYQIVFSTVPRPTAALTVPRPTAALTSPAVQQMNVQSACNHSSTNLTRLLLNHLTSVSVSVSPHATRVHATPPPCQRYFHCPPWLAHVSVALPSHYLSPAFLSC